MSDDIKSALDALLKQSTSLSTQVEGMTAGFTTLNTRLDSVEKRYDDDKKHRAQARVDSFKFSPRVKDESEKAYQRRHDEEEKTLRVAMDTAGMPSDIISDKARDARRDAEEKADAAKADEFPPKKADEFPPKKADAKKADGDDDKDEKKADEFPPKKADAKKADGEDDDERMDEDDEKDKKADEFPPKKADAKKADSRKDSFAKLENELATLKAGMKPLSDEDLVQVSKMAKRCDSIYTALGTSMPRLMPGENLVAYRHKLAADLKKHTKYKDVELSTIAADSVGFDLMVEDIFEKAESFAMSPARLKPGELVQRTSRSDSGHVMHTYEGSSSAWMQRFAGPVQNHATLFKTQERK